MIVVNLTNTAVDAARKLISQVRGSQRGVGWALIKDEGDSFDRSKDEVIEISVPLSFGGCHSDYERQETRLKQEVARQVLASNKREIDSVELKRLSKRVDMEFNDTSSQIDVTVRLQEVEKKHQIKDRLASFGSNLDGFLASASKVPDITSNDLEYIKLEKAMHRLTGKLPLYESESQEDFFGAPCSILSVSATTLPIFIRVAHEGKTKLDTYVVRPSEDEYVGLSNQDMEPMDGQFLVPNELTIRNAYWSDKVESLYKDAHSDPRPGALVLDAVNPRVTAHTNTKDRAKMVKSKYPRYHVVVLRCVSLTAWMVVALTVGPLLLPLTLLQWHGRNVAQLGR